MSPQKAKPTTLNMPLKANRRLNNRIISLMSINAIKIHPFAPNKFPTSKIITYPALPRSCLILIHH